MSAERGTHKVGVFVVRVKGKARMHLLDEMPAQQLIEFVSTTESALLIPQNSGHTVHVAVRERRVRGLNPVHRSRGHRSCCEVQRIALDW